MPPASRLLYFQATVIVDTWVIARDHALQLPNIMLQSPSLEVFRLVSSFFFLFHTMQRGLQGDLCNLSISDWWHR